jgi:hypothetical protein
MGEVVFSARGIVRGIDYERAWIDLIYKGQRYGLTMHKHHLAKHDLFEQGRWFDFKVVREDGALEIELNRRQDLEDNEYSRRAKLIDTNYLDEEQNGNNQQS